MQIRWRRLPAEPAPQSEPTEPEADNEQALRRRQPFGDDICHIRKYTGQAASQLELYVSDGSGGANSGIVTLTNFGRILASLREAKPLKTLMATISEYPRFRNKFD